MHGSTRESAGDNAAKAGDLLEQLSDEWEWSQEWEEDLRDPHARWRRRLRKVWEAVKVIASFGFLIVLGWGIYDQYPETRGVIKTFSEIVVVFGLGIAPLAIWQAISRARRRRRRRREFLLHELGTIKEALNERYKGDW